MFADELKCTAGMAQNPIWAMPGWALYWNVTEPKNVNFDNAPSVGQTGKVTVALYLRRFVTDGQRYIHFDICSVLRHPNSHVQKVILRRGCVQLYQH